MEPSRRPAGIQSAFCATRLMPPVNTKCRRAPTYSASANARRRWLKSMSRPSLTHGLLHREQPTRSLMPEKTWNLHPESAVLCPANGGLQTKLARLSLKSMQPFHPTSRFLQPSSRLPMVGSMLCPLSERRQRVLTSNPRRCRFASIRV